MRHARILIVDDEPNARTALVEMLGDEGYEVRAAANGVEAMRECVSFAPDLVITDLQMPQLDGLQLVRRLPSQLTDPPATILISAYPAPRRHGSRFLSKPLDYGRLLDEIERAVAERATCVGA